MPQVETLEMDSLGRRVLIVRVDAEGLDLSRLTAAERDIASLVIEGHSNAEIARRRGTLLRTVEKHLSNINQKLGLSSRSELRAGGAAAPSTSAG